MLQEGSSEPDPTKKEDIEDVAAGGDPDKKKKKKKKPAKDKEKEPPKDDKKRKGPSSRQIQLIKEQIRKQKEEEERLLKEEEEKERLREEAEDARLEKLRLEQEKKDKKKQKEKERKDRLKAEGKLLTAKQRHDKQRAQAMLESLRAQGIEVPEVGVEKKPRAGTRVRTKKNQTQIQSQQSTEEEPSTNSGVTDDSRPKCPSEKDENNEDNDEGIKDSWDQESDHESHNSEAGTSKIQVSGPKCDLAKAGTQKKDASDNSSEAEDSAVSDSASSDEDSEESEEETERKTHAEKKREKAEQRIEAFEEGPYSAKRRPPQEIRKRQDYLYRVKELESYIDDLSVSEIIERLLCMRITTKKQNPKSLRKVLKSKYKKLCEGFFSKDCKLAHQFRNNMSRGLRNPYHFDYFVVIDFEATCEQRNPDNYQHEIIQFPAVLIDVHRLRIVDEFNSYCKPRLQPKLSEFCVSLTGITQETVDSSPNFSDVLEDFNQWLISHGLGTRYSFSLVADGYCDMGKFLYTQCMLSNVEYPSFAHQWVDIRLLFFNFYGVKWYKLPVTLELMGERFSGTLHNGLDDSKNIGLVLLHMIRGGANPIQNERIILDVQEQDCNPPSHKYALRTVKYLYPKDFFATRPNPNRLKPWNPKSFYNKENSFNSSTSDDFVVKTPVLRVNKLKMALKDATRKANEELSSSRNMKCESVPTSNV